VSTINPPIETGVLFVAVWWAWICSVLANHGLNPERGRVRLMLFAQIGLGVLLACALPHAFDADAPLFAASYVVLQIGRTLLLLAALGKGHPQTTRLLRRTTVWFSVSALLWIAGARAAPADRLLLWAIAVAVELGAVEIGHWVPGLGRSPRRDAAIDGEPLAERCALLVTIVLGLSLLAIAFVGSVAIAWIHINVGPGGAARSAGAAADPGRMSRASHTGVHLLVLAGIAVAALAHQRLLAQPRGAVELALLLPLVGGATLFLLGNLWFKALAWKRAPVAHLGGFVLLAATVAVSPSLEPLGVGAAVAAILAVVAVWESASLRRVAALPPPEPDRRSSLPAKMW
jgi:low temperature requirement protein LtrA